MPGRFAAGHTDVSAAHRSALGGAMLVDRDNFNGADRAVPRVELASHLDIPWAAINPRTAPSIPSAAPISASSKIA
ncbi:MAG: hypothetical protein HZY76_07295 [Anaerolineae bacterium]|nr:MAG: hypothetical protein HZY76_07295 [Anaerolineae bacterium]